jgi:uncharacterized Zn finger protein (UPF0148 family)
MNMDTCPFCGAELETFEGESFCPDCDRWELEEEIRQADLEAALFHQQEAEQASRPKDNPIFAAGEPPF